MQPTPSPVARVANIRDIPAVAAAQKFYNDVSTQLTEATAILDGLTSASAKDEKLTTDMIAANLLERAAALLSGETEPKSDQERINLLARKCDTLRKAKPEALRKFNTATAQASNDYCKKELPDVLARMKIKLELLGKLQQLNALDAAAIHDIERRGFDLRGGVREVRYREEFLPTEIADLKKDVGALEDQLVDFGDQVTRVVFLTAFTGYAGLVASAREVRDLPTALARQLIREGSVEPSTAAHESRWQRLQDKRAAALAAQAQGAFA